MTGLRAAKRWTQAHCRCWAVASPYGTSGGHAAYVKDNPVSPADICATIYHCLGIDPEMTVQDRAGQPIAIARGGKPIREIIA